MFQILVYSINYLHNKYLLCLMNFTSNENMNSDNKKQKMKEQAIEMAQLIFQLEKICQEKENYFANKFNLTSGEFRCLRLLKDNCYYSTKGIANQMDLTSGRITHIISSLEKKGYVTREIDTNDRRNIKVSLTDEALPFIQKLDKQYNKLHESIIATIEEQEREPMINSLDTMFSALTLWKEKNLVCKK